ncbi:hypothetical protein BDB00DRAFT_873976 [Zychaea mexicana]|uniref:uncharacterized protein n=1 Tax=Zychaea mexicana TaxID=64656 RepID=UPI0022FEBD40|nr:uncharacterized protein BDB00DRAFT_873976 [Zychaea mexicana]KAI9491768.1 hypothetical protein BDB00DRAFT_873976 [Zychaea mexicana]
MSFPQSSSSSFKSKWSYFMTRFNPDEHQQQQQQQLPPYDEQLPPNVSTSRRPSHVSSCCSTIAEDTFWSDSMSTISERSNKYNNSKRKDGNSNDSSSRPPRRKRHLLHLFRRRGSGASTSSSCSSLAGMDDTDYFEKETQRLQSLYELALDEINYAEDSRGSPYYVGDRVTAREAIDGCAIAFMQLQQQTTDSSLQSLLQSTMAPRLIELQSKFDALPLEQK